MVGRWKEGRVRKSVRFRWRRQTTQARAVSLSPSLPFSRTRLILDECSVEAEWGETVCVGMPERTGEEEERDLE